MDITNVGSSYGSGTDLVAGSNEILGKEDFLRILVTQLQNQDPIDPMKSEDFASQLAEFSSLEQLQNLNATVAQSSETDMLVGQSINNTMAAALIGQNVRALGNATQLTHGNAELNYVLPATASSVTVEILDENGTVLYSEELGGQSGGEHTYDWDGVDNTGHALDEGAYYFQVKGIDVNGNEITGDTLVKGLITGVSYYEGTAWLRVGDVNISMSDVLEITQNTSED